MIPNADSITHLHLLSVVNTEVGDSTVSGPVRLLDAGCGSGKLLAYLAQCLPVLNPQTEFEFFGLDVHDEGVQQPGFLQEAIEMLEQSAPNVSWRDNVVSISSVEQWPFPESYFDFIISNQVLEHVRDHDRFFSEIHRTLRPGGRSMHLFPLKHYIFEGHLHLPFVHRIYNHAVLMWYISLLSRLSLGKYRAQHLSTGISLPDYTERHADYMHHYTNYLSQTDLLRIGKRYRLRTSFRYTSEFYTSKLRSMFFLKPRLRYSSRRLLFLDWIAVYFLRYLSSVTLFLEKRNSY